MHRVSVNKVGLALGGLLAIFHAAWALMVFAGWAEPFMTWIFGLHFLNFPYTILPFSLGTAVLLVVVTGVIGYVMGAVLGWLWNLFHDRVQG